LATEMTTSPDSVKLRFGMADDSPEMFHVNTISPRLLDITERRSDVTPVDGMEQAMANFSQAYFGVFGFVGAAFGQRGLPTSHRIWNTLLWLARMAAVGAILAYIYPRLQTRLGRRAPIKPIAGTR
jgi:hypothetical protein